MNKCLIPAAMALLLSTTAASANEGLLDVSVIDNRGSGCPEADSLVFFPTGANLFTLIFTEHVAAEKGELQGKAVVANCDIDLQLSIESGYRVALKKLEYHGDIVLEPKTWLTLSVGYKFPTMRSTHFYNQFWYAFEDDDILYDTYYTRHDLTEDQLNWSGCDGDPILQISTKLQVKSFGDGDNSSISLNFATGNISDAVDTSFVIEECE